MTTRKDRPGWWVFVRDAWFPITARWATTLRREAHGIPLFHGTRDELLAILSTPRGTA